MYGNRFAFYGFTIDMNILFEKFVVGVLKKEGGLKIEAPKSESFWINGKKKNIELDGWLNQEKIIFDTKYKEAFEVPQDGDLVELGPFKVLNSDIYQVIAYCNHKRFLGSKGVLIYPLTQSESEENNGKWYLIKGFNIDIYVLSIKIDFKEGREKPVEIIEFVEGFNQLSNLIEKEGDMNVKDLGPA